MFNKSDKGNIKRGVSELGLSDITDREILAQACDAVSGVGVNIGFDWLSK